MRLRRVGVERLPRVQRMAPKTAIASVRAAREDGPEELAGRLAAFRAGLLAAGGKGGRTGMDVAIAAS